VRTQGVAKTWFVVWSLLVALLGFTPGLAIDSCPDAWISMKISTRLVAKMGAAGVRINPDTEVCVVTLRGCVKTGEQRQKAIATAGRVKKVTMVIDELKACEED
jgi:osmotically-inducible protein OsmY